MNQITEKESLGIIQEMIHRAKESYLRFNFYFLLWGWLLMFAGMGEYILDRQVQSEYAWVVWPAVGIIGGIIAGVHGAKKGKEAGAMTFMDRVFGYVWTGFVITLILLIVLSVSNRMNPGSYIMLLTGLPTFISGGVLRFKPLIIGGVLFWFFGFFSFFYFDEYRSLIFSLSIITGYILPGYMLKKHEENARV